MKSFIHTHTHTHMTLFDVHLKLTQFCKSIISSVTQSCPTLCNPMDCSTPGLPVHHQLPELAQTHVHRVSDAIQPSHPLSSPSPLAFNLSQHQGIFQWLSSSHQMAKALEFQLQQQSFQWIFRTDYTSIKKKNTPCLEYGWWLVVGRGSILQTLSLVL